MMKLLTNLLRSFFLCFINLTRMLVLSMSSCRHMSLMRMLMLTVLLMSMTALGFCQLSLWTAAFAI